MPLNESILYGFCQKCEQSWTFEDYQNVKEPWHCSAGKKQTDKCKPVWFLSPKQMKIISRWFLKKGNIEIMTVGFEKEDYEFIETEHALGVNPNYIRILELKPFIIAKILTEKIG